MLGIIGKKWGIQVEDKLKLVGVFLGGVGAAITFLFGSGVYWQYKESILKTEQAEREKDKTKRELIDKKLDVLERILA